MKTSLLTLLTLVLSSSLALGQSSPSSGPATHLRPLPGGAPETIGGDTADIRFLRMTADAKRLVYLADAEHDELLELYAIKPNGGPSLKLNAPFAAGRAGVSDFQLTPDGKRVLYLADHAARGRWELFSVPIGGGPVVKISRPGTGAMNLGQYVLTPDGKRVVFVDKLGARVELLVASLEGLPYTRLSRAEGDVNPQSIRILPDTSRVVFQSVSGSFTFTVRSARLDGSEAPIALSGPMVNFGQVPCELSADGARVVFGGQGGGRDLLSVPIDGSAAPVTLNGPLQESESVGFWNLAWLMCINNPSPSRPRNILMRCATVACWAHKCACSWRSMTC